MTVRDKTDYKVEVAVDPWTKEVSRREVWATAGWVLV